MRHFICVHEHEYGVTTYTLDSESDDIVKFYNGLDSEAQKAFAERLGINYEPENDERLYVNELGKYNHRGTFTINDFRE